MSEFDPVYHNNLYFSPDQQDLLLAALSSNNPSPENNSESKSTPGTVSSNNQQHSGYTGPDMFDSPSEGVPGSGRFGFGSDGSPFGEYDLDHDFDINGNEELIGDIPDFPGEELEPREKRKSFDGREDEESGKKRKEGDEKVSKKPGRKPLTSEPTTKRKAQNRAAQRAFRERKEKHLKDLEVKVDGLEKVSRETNHENSRLRAQVERLQVELKEYRKRLSWVSSGNSISPSSNLANGNGHLRSQSAFNNNNSNNDFSFEFPKFGDLPSAHLARNGSLTKPKNSASGPYSLMGAQPKIPGVVGRGPRAQNGYSTYNSASQSQFSNPGSVNSHNNPSGNIYSTRKGKFSYATADQGNNPYLSHSYENPIKNYTDSPSASSDSQQGHISSICTSPEPVTNSPSLGKDDISSNKSQPRTHGPSECEQEFCKRLGAACGCADNPIPAAMGKPSPQSNRVNPAKSHQDSNGNNTASNDIFLNDDSSLGIDWMVQQNGGQFDPVLFGDYRDPQDAVLSQEFNEFFNDAFQLPDLGNVADTFNLGNVPAPKKDLVTQIDQTVNAADDEVVPGEDRSQMLSCNKIWDRLQSMDKFRNGDIDVDNLCTELRTKARCSEGGVVVNRQDVDDIMGRAS